MRSVITLLAVTLTQVAASEFCCMAYTASCLACSAGMEVAEYCAANPSTVGCENYFTASPGTVTWGGNAGGIYHCRRDEAMIWGEELRSVCESLCIQEGCKKYEIGHPAWKRISEVGYGGVSNCFLELEDYMTDIPVISNTTSTGTCKKSASCWTSYSRRTIGSRTAATMPSGINCYPCDTCQTSMTDPAAHLAAVTAEVDSDCRRLGAGSTSASVATNIAALTECCQAPERCTAGGTDGAGAGVAAAVATAPALVAGLIAALVGASAGGV